MLPPPPTTAGLYTLDLLLDGLELRIETPPALSPDGRWLLYRAHGQLWRRAERILAHAGFNLFAAATNREDYAAVARNRAARHLTPAEHIGRRECPLLIFSYVRPWPRGHECACPAPEKGESPTVAAYSFDDVRLLPERLAASSS
jgi:hypothetical protein